MDVWMDLWERERERAVLPPGVPFQWLDMIRQCRKVQLPSSCEGVGPCRECPGMRRAMEGHITMFYPLEGQTRGNFCSLKRHHRRRYQKGSCFIFHHLITLNCILMCTDGSCSTNFIIKQCIQWQKKLFYSNLFYSTCASATCVKPYTVMHFQAFSIHDVERGIILF